MAIRPASCGKGVLSLEVQQHTLGIQPVSGHNQACHDPHFVGKMLGKSELNLDESWIFMCVVSIVAFANLTLAMENLQFSR